MQQDNVLVWVGILNPGGVNCAGAACSGKVRWLDGTVFTHSTWMTNDFPDFSSSKTCATMKSDGTFSGEDCSQSKARLCEYDCTGESNVRIRT